MAEESKSPFELDPGKLCEVFMEGTSGSAGRRSVLDSWFRRHTIAKPEVEFFAARPDHFKVGGKDVFWGELAWHWKRGQDAVFTFLGVEVPVERKAMAWEMLADLLKPGTSLPCPLCCLLLLSSHHSGRPVLLEQPGATRLVVSGCGVWSLLVALSPLIIHPQRPVFCVVGCCLSPELFFVDRLVSMRLFAVSLGWFLSVCVAVSWPVLSLGSIQLDLPLH